MRPQPTIPNVASDSRNVGSMARRSQGCRRYRSCRSARMNPRLSAIMKTDRVVGDFVDAVVRDVADGNASRGRGGDIDVIVPHSAAHDDAAACQSCDRLFRNRRFVIDNQAIGVGDLPIQFLRTAAVQAFDRRQSLQIVGFQTGGRFQRVGDEHTIHRSSSARVVCRPQARTNGSGAPRRRRNDNRADGWRRNGRIGRCGERPFLALPRSTEGRSAGSALHGPPVR